MNYTRFIREIVLGINCLLQHKLRSLLTMLGVVFGVGSVIAMLAVGEGANRDALERIRKLGSNNVIINSIKPIEEETSQEIRARMSVYGLSYIDQDRIAEGFGHVNKTAPVKILRQEGQLGSRTLDMRVLGTTPEWFELVRRDTVAGRILTELDMDFQNNVVVLTEYGARRLLATERSVGQPLRIGGNFFEVIGIIQSEEGQGAGVQTPDQEIDAYIPLSVCRVRFGDITTRRTAGAQIRERVELHQILVQINALENVEKTAGGIDFMLSRFHKKKGLSSQCSVGSPPRGRRNQTHIQHRAGIHRRNQFVGGRHRHYEHHAGLGYRANP